MYTLTPEDVEHFSDRLREVARRWARKRVLAADDIEQSGWVGVMEAARSYDPEKGLPFYVWAMHKVSWAVQNAHEAEYRQRGLREQWRLREGAEAPDHRRADDPDAQMDLAQAYAKLPPEQQEVLHDRYWRDMTQEQCADARDWRQRQVSDREREALEMLRVYLSPPGEKRVNSPPKRKWSKK